jgi:hypothetical protein
MHIPFFIDCSDIHRSGPGIVLGISGRDCTVYPARVDVDGKNVAIRGFDVQMRSWYETHVWSCAGFWVAYTS